MSCSIKICGITTIKDARMVTEAGADYLGVLVDVARSPRSLTVDKAREIFSYATIPVILLTFDLNTDQVVHIVSELNPFAVQLAGSETEEDVRTLKNILTCEIWKSLHIPISLHTEMIWYDFTGTISSFTDAGINRIILDSSVREGPTLHKGGTGCTFDWSLARKIKSRIKTFIFLAGGITPDNVQDALIQVNPDGIDLSSGVEISPGKKDPQLVKRLISIVRNTGTSYRTT